MRTVADFKKQVYKKRAYCRYFKISLSDYADHFKNRRKKILFRKKFLKEILYCKRHNIEIKDYKSHLNRRKFLLRTQKRAKNILSSVIQRCRNPLVPAYKYYGGRGVKCFLTIGDVQYLWKRDRASRMKRPSLDRIDPEWHYEFKNCRFLELSENIRRKRQYIGDDGLLVYQRKIVSK